MKVLAYIALHYGSEYLHYAIKSIDDYVDKILILYTEKPSYGQGTKMQCPDDQKTLEEIAFNASDKIEWVTIPPIIEEHRHRKLGIEYANKHGYSLIMVVDSDEVWNPNEVEPAIKAAWDTGAQQIGVAGSQWYHLSRS